MATGSLARDERPAHLERAPKPNTGCDFGYSEVPAAELKPGVLLHHFDDLADACAAVLS